jgi:hypothetical protein
MAFLWRMDKNNVRQTDLGVSRDGTNWTTYANIGLYMPNGRDFGGQTIVETLAQGGLVRRGDRIWQYAQYVTGAHGSGSKFNVRLTQRLDGFVSLDAGVEVGKVTTVPFIFEGNKLVLNIKAKGFAKVAITDRDGKMIDGFGLDNCEIIKNDSVCHVVRWKGEPDLNRLAGKVVRLKFEMQSAKLYAFEFTE